jgi:hypothetical protein
MSVNLTAMLRSLWWELICWWYDICPKHGPMTQVDRVTWCSTCYADELARQDAKQELKEERMRQKRRMQIDLWNKRLRSGEERR